MELDQVDESLFNAGYFYRLPINIMSIPTIEVSLLCFYEVVSNSIDGGGFESAEGTITEKSDGHYTFDAVANDTNGNVITWKFSATDANDSSVTFQTVR